MYSKEERNEQRERVKRKKLKKETKKIGRKKELGRRRLQCFKGSRSQGTLERSCHHCPCRRRTATQGGLTNHPLPSVRRLTECEQATGGNDGRAEKDRQKEREREKRRKRERETERDRESEEEREKERGIE